MMELYDLIGAGYNTTRTADSFITERILQHLADTLYPNAKLLDLGCGTGNYTIKLSELPIGIFGLDPSELMLSEARQKSEKIRWLAGNAEGLPFEEATFDAVICIQTIHHWKDLKTAMKNTFRVLKAKGKMIIFTSTKEQMEHYWLNHYFPGLMTISISQMPSHETITEACSDAGFVNIETEKYFIQEGLEDLFLYSGKNNPALYFNARIRNGISSFANDENGQEILTGLKKLNADMQTGYFEKMKENYHDDLGDYLFFVYNKQDLLT
jgi:ubiquinone/menaquinone biosynthesis C-methylase UbiE